MRLLVLGGTSFVGRHLVQTALDEGHTVTVFHRGRTNPDLFPQVEHRRGDRSTGDLASLRDGRWDATVDVSAYVPAHVTQALAALDGRQGHYVLVSSISAYDPATATADEGSPTYSAPDPDTEQVTAETYGPLKAACERHAVRSPAASSVAIVRPTFVVGPHDPTDRFTYWARVVAHGGQVPLAWPDAPVQVIDARDLGDFLLGLAASGTAGAFDAVGPFAPLRDLLAAMVPPGVHTDLVDVGAERLEAAGVVLPLVDGDPASIPLMSRPGSRAMDAGLRCRSLSATARDTVAWDTERGTPELRVGPSPAQRAVLLAGDPIL
jgi:2'-hydroxyisoflavone reductase